MLDGGEPVGDDDAGAAHAVQGLGHLLLGLVVQGAGGLVEQQDPGLRGHGPGDHQPLPLAAGDAALALGDHGVHPHGHGPDIVGHPGQLRRLPGVVHAEVGGGDGDIGEDVPLEQAAVLGHHAHVPPQGVEVQAAHIPAVVVDGPLLRGLEAQEQPHEGALAAAGGPHDGQVFPGADLQIEAVDDVGHGLVVAEGDVGQLDGPGDPGHRFLLLRPLRLRLQDGLRQLQDGLDLRGGDGDARVGGEGPRHGPVGGAERQVVGVADAGLHRQDVDGDGSDERHRQGDGGVDLQEGGRVVYQLRALGVDLGPPGEGPLFGACQLDLLHPGDQGVGQARLLGAVLQVGAGHPQLQQGGQQGHGHRGQQHQQGRPHQRGSEEEDLPDVQQGGEGREPQGEHAAEEQVAELVDGPAAAGQLTGAVILEEGGGQAHQPHHHGRLHRQAHLDLDAAHGQLSGHGEHLGDHQDAEHENGGAHQDAPVPALQHEAGEERGDPGQEQTHQRHHHRQADEQDVIAQVQAALHVGDQVGDAQPAQGQGRVEAQRLRQEQGHGLPVHRALHPVGVPVIIAPQGPGQQHHGHPVLPAVDDQGTVGVPVPVFGEGHVPVHHPVGTEGVFQLILRVLDALGDVRRLAVVVFQDLVDGCLGHDAAVLQRAAAALAQHHGGHFKEGVLKDILVGLSAHADLFLKPTHTLTS